MSHPAYLLPRVEITERICILNVVISDIFVVTFPGYSIQFTPTVIRTLIGYYLCGHTSTNMREYLTMRPTGILMCATKLIVLSLVICPQVVQIPLTIRFAGGLLFLFILLALDLFTVIYPLCLDQ